MDLDTIVASLARHRQRATYGAVAALVGTIPRSVMQARPCNHLNSWVVAEKDHEPTGYAENEKAPDLKSRDKVIDEPAELRRWLMDRFFADLDVDKKLAMRFLMVFSRFEYSLKRTGYIRHGSKYAAADWDKFSCDIEDVFELQKTSEFQEAVEFLGSQPPRRQIRKGDGLGWEDNCRSGDDTAKWTLRLIRCVRNNFFHGGKFPGGPVLDPSRNSDLLRACLVVLEACLWAHAPTRYAFFCEEK